MPSASATGVDVLGRALRDVDRVDRAGADRDLLHVDRRAGEEHRAALGDRDDGDRAGLAERGEPRPLERVDRDVDLGPFAVPDLLAVVEHRRLVLLALADDDDAAHRDAVEDVPHRVDRGLVGGLLLAAADPARAAIAPASVTRTSSIAMLRSGAALARALMRRSYIRLRRVDSDKVEAARDDTSASRGRARGGSLLLALEHAMLVVEAVEVVGDADRIRGIACGPRFAAASATTRRELGEALDQLPLLLRQRAPATRRLPTSVVASVAQDPGDARVRVLDVVDGVLLRALRGEVDVDLDRLVGPAVDEVPARRVDADLVDEVVEEDDVAAPLRHLRLLAALRQMHELVEEHLDALRVVAEQPAAAAYQCDVPWWSAPRT